MKFTRTGIEGCVIIEPRVFGDERGYFCETFRESDAAALAEAAGLAEAPRFIQDNESKSSYGVVRGLHFQKGEAAQAKLVRAVRGRVLDVAVDLRPGSATYGKHVAVELSEDNHLQFFIPRGFAHGYAVLSEEALFQYKCDNYYCPEAEGGIAWNDPDVAINWTLPESDIILSEKDRNRITLKELI